jgi:RNA polymerase sigma-70 factor (ECF subfamily)
LRDIEELSYEQIAEVMQTSLGTVKSRLVRGREALRKRLERHLPAFGMALRDASENKRRSGPVGNEIEVIP